MTPVRDSPCTPRLRSVSSYGNIRAVTTARNLNKSLQNLSLTEESGSSVAFSPGNLSTSSSASSTLGSPENEEYILSFETIDKMRRVSSYSALNSLIGESLPPPFPAACMSSLAQGLLCPNSTRLYLVRNTSQTLSTGCKRIEIN